MPLWFQEQLVPLRRRELHDLVFDGRTVPRTSRRNRAAVHRGLSDVLLNDPLSRLAEERDPTRQLRGVSCFAWITRRPARCWPEMRPGVVERLDFRVLPFELTKVH